MSLTIILLSVNEASNYRNNTCSLNDFINPKFSNPKAVYGQTVHTVLPNAFVMFLAAIPVHVEC